MQAQWTCIVLAGQRPGKDLFAQHFGLQQKALIPLRGEPMITTVLRTLNASPHIGQIIVLSQDPSSLHVAVAAGGGATLLESESGISTSIKNVVNAPSFVFPVLVTTADHPLLTGQMIDEFLCHAQGDVAVAMVERANMLAQFPDAKRTWLRFADGVWSGANLFALMSGKSSFALDLWAEVEQDRKRSWRLFWHFGPQLALRAITRTIGLRAALDIAGKRLGLEATLIPMSDPVAAIDVDKLSDHALAEKIIAGRESAKLNATAA